MTRHKRRRVSTKSMYQWHRYLGVTAALLVILLAVTGLMLNHTTELELDKSYITSPVLLDHYGIETARADRAFLLGDRWLSQWDKQLYLDTTPLGRFSQTVTGALRHQEMLVISLGDSLLLYTPDGELIEKMGPAQGIPAPVEALGLTSDGRLAIRGGTAVHVADADLIDWQTETSEVKWSEAAALPERLQDTLRQQAQGGRLSVERVVLDLHSGRILGNAGVWIMDGAAVLLLFLAFSGSWLWLMRLIRNRQRNRK